MGKRQDPSQPRQKPGRKSTFQGEQLEFLVSKQAEFKRLHDAGTTSTFWGDFMTEWWTRFPESEELLSDTDVGLEEKNPEDNSDDGEDSEKKAPAKKKYQTKKQKMLSRMKSWFRYRQTVATRDQKNPWTDALAELKRPPQPPKKMALWQYYLKVHREDVEAEMAEKWPDNISPQDALGKRGDIARTQLAAKSDIFTDQLRERLEEDHQKVLEIHEATLSTPEETSPDDQAYARERVSQVIKPLLNLVRKYTGAKNVTMLIGDTPLNPNDDFFLVAINSGLTVGSNPRDWVEWDPSGFTRKVLQHLMAFLCECTASPPNREGHEKSSQAATAEAW
ncbi:hypothetical protein BD410DRAFT_846701 [Rickenella mellea]|uniref:Uncharacterized protein n=1 Tax=Rickenella mellea TaxID=50990 RepID=A0A4Y7PH31_9AGAM|nr:hypothetical protein BD410DRAFT_846701 [Rickenella mellea]